MVDVPLDSSRTFRPQVCCLLHPAIGASRYKKFIEPYLDLPNENRPCRPSRAAFGKIFDCPTNVMGIKRKTKRVEDEAYFLLWIFSANLSMPYGERRTPSFASRRSLNIQMTTLSFHGKLSADSRRGYLLILQKHLRITNMLDLFSYVKGILLTL